MKYFVLFFFFFLFFFFLNLTELRAFTVNCYPVFFSYISCGYLFSSHINR